MKNLKRNESNFFNLLELYAISKNLSNEILLDEYIQSRGTYYSYLSEHYAQTKRRVKIKLLLTKLFYSVVFGILPIIPLFAYFEFMNLLTSGSYEFEIIIFATSLLYGIFFLLQFFNFLLMTIIETTVIMSGKAIDWFKTLPLSNINLKHIVYFTIFRNFDIPIITIILAFPISMLIGTSNVLLFLISLGISFINTFLAFHLIIIISERLNRVLNINDESSKRNFFIRLFNIFSYVFLILGSVYLIQWASTSIGTYFDLFITSGYPGLINVILSSIPYPFSQSYLIALTFAPTSSTLPTWIGTFIGISLLLLISFLSYKGSLKAIKKVLISELYYRHKAHYIENIKKSIKVKPISTFKALLKKDLISASRDLKVFLSFIMPILLSFIFTIYLNLQNISTSEPIEFQIFRIWFACMLICPVIGSILVFSLLNLESTGQSILESLPLIPREQAKAKIFLMFIILNIALISPSLLFIMTSRFLTFLIGILFCLPFAWIFLFISFELRIYFFGRKLKSFVVGDMVIGNNFFKLLIIFVIPLSICIWIISVSTLISTFSNSFLFYFTGFITAFLIGGFIFSISFFDKLFPLVKLTLDKLKIAPSIRTIENPTFFTRHTWISIIMISFLDLIFGVLSLILVTLLVSFIPLPEIWLYPYEYNFINYLFYFFYNNTPTILYFFMFSLLYFILIPKVFGIPYGKKKIFQYLDDIGCNWLKKIFEYSKYILIGSILLITTLLVTFLLLNREISYDLNSEWFYIIFTLNSGFWFEIIYRGIFLTFLRKNYGIKKAIFFHLIIIYISNLLSSYTFNLFYFFQGDSIQLIGNLILSVIYHVVMGYIFIKSKNLLPNLIIYSILVMFFSPLGLALWYLNFGGFL